MVKGYQYKQLNVLPFNEELVRVENFISSVYSLKIKLVNRGQIITNHVSDNFNQKVEIKIKMYTK